MAKTLDEILAENDALTQQTQLREYLLNLTKDEFALAAMSRGQLQGEYKAVIKVLQDLENKRKIQKGDILANDKVLNKSFEKLGTSIRRSSKEVSFFNDGLLGSSEFAKKFGNQAIGAALLAVSGFKGINAVLKKTGDEYDRLSVPLTQITAGITENFGAATDASGEFADSFAGRLASAETGTRDLVAAAARGQLATDARFRQFSGNLEEADQQRAKATEDLKKAFGDELFAIQTGLEDPNRALDLITFQKILGATGKQMGDLAGRAQIMGTSIEAQAGVARRSAMKMGKAFGVEGKVVAKAVNELRSDFRGFGTFTEDQLAKTAASARKLGLSLEGIKKLNVFDDFDKAAESAAMLGQSFGLNIDAFELFNAESPEDRLRMIQEAASQAGLDIANMSRVEMNYLSDLTGMGVEDTMKALSDSGMEMQSQLGDVPDVAQTAQEQTAQLIKAQEEVGLIIARSSEQIGRFPDTAANMAKNLKDMIEFAEGGASRLGLAIGEAVRTPMKEGRDLAASETAKEISGAIQRTLISVAGDVSQTATGSIKAASALLDAITRQVKEGKSIPDALRDVVAAPPQALKDAAEEMAEGTERLGSKVTGAVKATTGGAVNLTGTTPEPEYDAYDLFMDAEDSDDLLDKIRRAKPAVEKPAKPEVSPTSAAPAAARDRTVTAEARRDADGNFTATGQDTQANQTINVVLKVDGKLLADTVLAQQMTNDSLAGSTVGGNLRNAIRVVPGLGMG